MEEILASIRRIISEDGDGTGRPAVAPNDDVLELTQIVQDEEPVSQAAPAVQQPPPPPAPQPDPPAPEPPIQSLAERLISQGTVQSAAHRFADLARAATPDPLEGVRGGRTVEEIVVELLKPMLREWLDENLPSIVERLVEREIRYLSRRVETE